MMRRQARKVKSKIKEGFFSRVELSELPDYRLIDVITVPREQQHSPWRMLAQRFLWAMALVVFVTLVVYFDRGGYNQELTFLDAAYYSSVSLTTVGYGDIVPVTQEARLINLVVITPARLAFLILLVGATLSVLTDRTRRTYQIQSWRKNLKDHTVVIGYGTKGAGAVAALLADDVPSSQIVVIDDDRSALANAEHHGLVTVYGDGTKTDVLNIAGVSRAKAVVVTPSRDDTAVLVTLSVRELAPKAQIVASVRESENSHLLRQSGADSVVTSAETAGRLLGMATQTPTVVEMIEDLLSPSEGFSVAERPVREFEVGSNPRHLTDIVLAVIRNDVVHRVDTSTTHALKPGDRLLYIRHAVEEPEDVAIKDD